MEHTIVNLKVILAGILAMLVVCAMAAPALAQDGDGASATAGDASAQAGGVQVQIQYCPQVVNQYAAAVQNNSGGGIAAAIAQDLDISQNAVNACIQAGGDINFGDGGGDDGGGTPAEDQYTRNDDADTGRAVSSEGVILATIPNKVLANTGGLSAASILLPAGALLVVSGMMMAFWVGNRRR